MTCIRVFIVDNEPLTRTSLADFLQEMGYTTVVADGGEMAIQLHQEEAFEVCIVDIRMPGIGGVDTLLALHHIAPQSHYIVYTGSPQFLLPPALEKIGLAEFDIVRKPLLDMNIFVECIEGRRM